MNLLTPLSEFNRVGKVLASRLRFLGIETAQDLLFYYPFRYEDYSSTKIIAELEEGSQVTIKGKIEHIGSKRSPRKRKIITEAIVADDSGQLRVVWFGQPFISKVLKVGESVYLSGKIKSDMFGMQMVGPSYEKVSTSPNPSLAGGESATAHTARIVPIYPLTAGITEKQMRFLISQILPLTKEISDWLPEEIRKKGELIDLSHALSSIHYPDDWNELKKAEKRLKFDELFLLQLRSEMMKQQIKKSTAPHIAFQEDLIKQFVQSLPFELTKDQKIAAWEILQDLQKSEPMNRLLEGDVGSGKTVVAAMVMYNTILSGYQSVIMAPTEVLAAQHFESFQNIFKKSDIRIGLLSRSKAECVERITNEELRIMGKEKSFAAKKRELMENVKAGEIQIMIGTHALLSEDVKFKKLGLVVVDEQHRFGVEQRKNIRERSGNKKLMPHFLSMTATPIPRTFALTLYGDLDLSIIKTKPSGRKPIITRVVEPHNRQKAYDFIRGQVNSGRQVFVICPLIEQSEDDPKKKEEMIILPSSDERKSVLDEFEKLSKKIFPDLKVNYLHGKMKPKEKDEIMNDFSSGKIDILVSTSVVEVGVNIPNATVMMIESAERFGLAQLHQFRGRVGRSDHQSYCFLFTDSISESVNERLKFFESTLDGFALAEYDLQTRGPGEVYGTTQSGMMNFRLATLQDTDLMKLTKDIARTVDFDEFPTLKEKVKEWERKVHLE